MVGARATVVLFVSSPCLPCLPAVHPGAGNHVSGGAYVVLHTTVCKMQEQVPQADKQQQVMSSCSMHALPFTWFLEEQGDDISVSMWQQAQLI